MRKLSLTLAVLLLSGIFLPTVAKANEDDLLRQITSPAPAMTPAQGPGCEADLPLGTPGVSYAAGEACGSCSDSYCQGRYTGWSCTRGLGYTCQNAYGLECSVQPLQWKCTCWPPNTPFP